jgi:phosphoribosyl-ATP pyrophosphohydrolase
MSGGPNDGPIGGADRAPAGTAAGTPLADARPLVVCAPDGRPFQVLEENEKGFKKSLERGRLWALHPGTGRLLPFYEGTPVTVRERDGWYEARLAEEPREVDAAPATEPRAQAETGARSETGGSAGPGTPISDSFEAADSREPLDSAEAVDSPEAAGPSDLGAVLRDLASVVSARRRELPEGSYTTHLFESGGEKIRKKAGEEAIELLLAGSRETVISESADFLYHLLVLLENEGITLDEIARELERR